MRKNTKKLGKKWIAECKLMSVYCILEWLCGYTDGYFCLEVVIFLLRQTVCG